MSGFLQDVRTSLVALTQATETDKKNLQKFSKRLLEQKAKREAEALRNKILYE